MGNFELEFLGVLFCKKSSGVDGKHTGFAHSAAFSLPLKKGQVIGGDGFLVRSSMIDWKMRIILA